MKKPKNLWIAIISLITANVVLFIIKPGGDLTLTIISDLFPVICSIIAGYYLFIAVRSFKEFDFTKISWGLILVSILIFILAETTYGFLEVGLGYDMDEEFPTIADYIWVIGYIPMFAGLLMMFIGYKKSGLPMGKPKVLALVSILIFLISAVVIYFIMVPIITDQETALSDKIFYLFYPIADILIVIPAALLVYITSLFGGGIIARPWKYLTYGFILFTFSDLIYSYLDWMGLYGGGNWIDIGWNLGYLLFAIAGLYQYQMVKSLN
jgi:hypothetical protein